LVYGAEDEVGVPVGTCGWPSEISETAGMVYVTWARAMPAKAAATKSEECILNRYAWVQVGLRRLALRSKSFKLQKVENLSRANAMEG
jgi:hypothetical protein